MKQFNHLNRTIKLAIIAILIMTLGSPITAMAGKHPSLSQLSTQVENLTRQVEALQRNGQGSQHITVKSSSSSKYNHVGIGRNKNRKNKPFKFYVNIKDQGEHHGY